MLRAPLAKRKLVKLRDLTYPEASRHGGGRVPGMFAGIDFAAVQFTFAQRQKTRKYIPRRDNSARDIARAPPRSWREQLSDSPSLPALRWRRVDGFLFDHKEIPRQRWCGWREGGGFPREPIFPLPPFILALYVVSSSRVYLAPQHAILEHTSDLSEYVYHGISAGRGKKNGNKKLAQVEITLWAARWVSRKVRRPHFRITVSIVPKEGSINENATPIRVIANRSLFHVPVILAIRRNRDRFARRSSKIVQPGKQINEVHITTGIFVKLRSASAVSEVLPIRD